MILYSFHLNSPVLACASPATTGGLLKPKATAHTGSGIKTNLYCLKLLLVFLTGVFFLSDTILLPAEGINIPQAEKPFYTIDTWSDMDRGSHRARIEVPKKVTGAAVQVYIPWRRRDKDPQNKRLILVDAKTGQTVKNQIAVSMNREALHFVFQPTTPGGLYYLYYLPHTIQNGSGGYSGNYLPPLKADSPDAPDPQWLKTSFLTPKDITLSNWKTLPSAKLIDLQARGDFEKFYPMEVVAKQSEREVFLQKNSADTLFFPEDRTRPIVMTSDLPLSWIEKGPSSSFSGTVLQNEYYVFQIGVFAVRKPFENITISYSALKTENGDIIPAKAMTCFNLGGIDSRGNPFSKRLDIPEGKIQALWFGVDVSRNATPGNYKGTLTISGNNQKETTFQIALTVEKGMLEDRGDSEIWRHSRLRWLNSTLGIDDDIFAPFIPLKVENNSVSCIGRTVEFSQTGFPAQIICGDNLLLARPVQLTLQTENGARQPLISDSKTLNIQKKTDSTVLFETEGINANLQFRNKVKMEFDGHVHFQVDLTAVADTNVTDISLELPFKKEAVPYLMGLGQPGGKRPTEKTWKWGGPIYNDSFWLGDVHGGLQCELRGAGYCGPMVNLYWSLGQLQPPKSWNNDGKGGCTLTEMTNTETVLVSVNSGARLLKKGENLTFEFAFLITPVKPLDTKKQFSSRYYHSPEKPEVGKKLGANIINIHHANELNLYINYPFLTVPRLSQYIEEAHREGMKVKLYYTVRELTNHITEWAAIRSLGTEILADGNGGGYPWCREHFIDHYTPSWYDRLPNGEVSASVVTSGESRWYNYYIEGLQWMIKNMKIDGLYLDDVTYDRDILKRMRKVMEKNRSGCMIDLHSNTGFSRGPANQYMEFFPYIDKIWFGESFNYDSAPDYWLTEISGIPYGVMGEMLQNGGNAWRGMVYGMTSRLPWTENILDLVPQVWKVWNDVNIADSKMIGYWEKNAPITTDTPGIFATTYLCQGKVLLSIASWNPNPVNASLKIDWSALHLDSQKAKIIAPAMPGPNDPCRRNTDGTPKYSFQSGQTFKVGDTIPMTPGRGWLLIISE